MWLNVVLAVAISMTPQITDPETHTHGDKKSTTEVLYQKIDGDINGSDDLAYLEGDILFGRDERSPGVGSVYS